MHGIDFKRIAHAALGQSLILLSRWLPGGKVDGREYKSLNPTRSDSKVGSFAVNVDSGKWGDFASGDAGLDLISLYAYLHGLSQLDAAKEVAAQMGMDVDKQVQQAPQEDAVKKKSEWIPVLQVPEDAGPYPVAHVVRGRPEMHWEYFDADGRLLGVVYRFVTSDGGKEVLPCVYAHNSKSGKCDWRWMAFPETRPLYGLYELAQHPNKPVLLVEGEKCADAAQAMLNGEFVCVSWPGGSKAVGKIDWSPLFGRLIHAWADCDNQRDKQGEVLPEHKQPGMAAMLKIREIIGDKSIFHLVDIPPPGGKPDGWDVADAITEGMQEDDLRRFIANTRSTGDASPDNAVRKTKAQKSNVQPSSDEQRTLIDRFALIYSTETVYDIDQALVMSAAAMRLAFGKSAVDWWLTHERRRMIRPDQLVFDPGSAGDDGKTINLFRGIEMEPVQGDFGPIMELLYHLCNDSAETDAGVVEVVQWVINWLAMPLQRLGTKMRSSLVFHGPQGTGKNLFFEIIAAIYGRYAIIVGQEQLEEKHNDWCSSKLFMIGDEVIARQELYHQKNKLKAFITSETIQINPKFLPIRTERNYVNVVFLSNEDQPLALEETDRRYFVVYTPPSRKDDLYQRVADCIANGGIEAFYDYLLGLDLHGFTAFSRPPMTRAKRELINLGMKPEHRFVYEWINGYLPIFWSPCTAGQLYRFFSYWATQNGERVPPQKIFTGSIKKFIGILTSKTDSDDELMTYKVVKLPDGSNGQSCERVWIPRGHKIPDGFTEGEWVAGAIARFDGYFQDYRRHRTCAE